MPAIGGQDMHKQGVFCLALLSGLTASAQTINLGGIVSNKTSQPIANAIVTLVRQGMKDTTARTGNTYLPKAWPSDCRQLYRKAKKFQSAAASYGFLLNNASPVKIELFDVKGNLLKKEALQNASPGAYSFDIAKNYRAAGLLVIKAAIGKREVSFPYATMTSGKYALNPSSAATSSMVGALAQAAAVVDTLKVAATGFQTKTTAITSYNNQQQNIALDSVGAALPDTGRSIGCGKSLGSLENGNVHDNERRVEPAVYDRYSR